MAIFPVLYRNEKISRSITEICIVQSPHYVLWSRALHIILHSKYLALELSGDAYYFLHSKYLYSKLGWFPLLASKVHVLGLSSACTWPQC